MIINADEIPVFSLICCPMPFALACQMHDSCTAYLPSLTLSPWHLRFDRGGATPASDLYSLGGTLLYLVSGQPPFAFPQERMRIDYKDKITVGPQLGGALISKERLSSISSSGQAQVLRLLGSCC